MSACPVKLILYKGFGHPINKPKQQLAVLEHNYEWFSQYIWGEQPPSRYGARRYKLRIRQQLIGTHVRASASFPASTASSRCTRSHFLRILLGCDGGIRVGVVVQQILLQCGRDIRSR